MTGTACARVASVDAWEALDSRGRPTVAALVALSDGAKGTAMAPSGASTGSHEASELRDGHARYDGRGVLRAVGHVRTVLAPALIGLKPRSVDDALAAVDPTPGFAAVGANAVLSVSVAARAAARSAGHSLAWHLAGPEDPLLLPMPMVNVLSGGAHAGAVIDIQDCLALPVGASPFSQALQWAASVRQSAAHIAAGRGKPCSALVADEGGVAVPLETNRAALGLVCDAIEHAGLEPGRDVGLAVDLAATQFAVGDGYRWQCENRDLNSAALIDEVAGWCGDFPVVSVEDVLGEDDWTGWKGATDALGNRIELVGDDLFVTQTDRLRRGISAGVANSALIKVNQNGLLGRTRDVLRLARGAGYSTVVSARSGDTEESWLADLAVGWRAGQIKVGSTRRSERTAKWNRQLQFEALERVTFAGPWPDGRPRREFQ
jgi:enolase